MPAAPDLQSLADAAEQAASAGDYAAAEQHLRLAVELQEASAGPMHPDLANALNNLGVVCERIGKSEDAEGCYRRAYAIASTVLDADHPFVALSARNLREFCEARGIPFEQPVAPLPAPALAEKAVGPDLSRAEAVGPDRRAEAEGPDFSRARKPEAVSPPPQPVQRPRRGLAVAAALGALALIAIAIVATRSRSTSSPAVAAPSVPSPAASTVAPRNPAPAAETPAPSAQAPVAPDARNAPDAPTNAPAAPAAPVAPGVAVTLVSAELCRTLETSGSEWRCAPASGVTAARHVRVLHACRVADGRHHRAPLVPKRSPPPDRPASRTREPARWISYLQPHDRERRSDGRVARRAQD